MKITDNLIQISVTELSRLGSKKFPFSVPGPSLKRAAMGRQAQKIYQENILEDILNYETEVSVNHRDLIEDYEIHIGGRIDGLFWYHKTLYLEEIKSVTLSDKEFSDLEDETFKNHLNQLAIYQWLVSLENPGVSIKAQLIYINLVSENIRVLPINYTDEQCRKVYLGQIARIFKLIEENRHHLKQRRAALSHLKWPFGSRRHSQEKMIEAVMTAHHEKQHLLVNAPTGTGKTIGSLYPTIEYALDNDKKIMFLTSKTTQQLIARDTISQILAGAKGVITLRLRATKKMCANDHYFCNELVCPYARNYQEKMDQGNILEILLELEQIEPDDIFRISKDAQVCPAETMLQLVSRADVIIGDINYAFDPIASLKQIFQDDYSHFIPIIDEAHNLYPRIQDTYSPGLSIRSINTLIEYCQHADASIYTKIMVWLQKLSDFFKDLNFTGEIEYANQAQYLPEIELDEWNQLSEELDDIFIAYFLYKVKNMVLKEDDPIDSFYFDFTFFVNILSYGGKEFFHIFEASEGGKLQIYCADPSGVISNRLSGFHSIIAMSATLKPFEFFIELTGFNKFIVKTIDLSSPFPQKNTMVIINSKVSTKFRNRIKYSIKIAEYINSTAKLRKGNYLIFFPSFEFLELCWPFVRIEGFEKIRQPVRSTDEEREAILDQLRSGEGYLFFAVMGGVFSEGVDFPGNMAIGAYIISPGIPPFNFYRELQLFYFENEYEKGNEYAYIYPGMNKVIQAAGRIIRTEKDRGIIFLVGSRFEENQFQELFPEIWFESGKVYNPANPHKLISGFWKESND